jgi:hypothetical protein
VWSRVEILVVGVSDMKTSSASYVLICTFDVGLRADDVSAERRNSRDVSLSLSLYIYIYCVYIYIYIHGDQKVSVHLVTIQKVTSNAHYLDQSDCLAADRQGQGDSRLTLTSSVFPNFNYVIMVSDWNSLKYFARFCTVINRCTETLITLYIYI